MRHSYQTTTGKLMLVVIVVALELVLFQDVWQILVIAPVAIATITLNLGFWFLVLRPHWMETRIIGMQLCGVAAAIASAVYMLESGEVLSSVGYQRVGPLGALLINITTAWAQSLKDPSATPAILLNRVANGATIIEFMALDFCGMVLIWGAGFLENQLRRRWQSAGAAGPASPPAIDARAATPL